MNLEELTTSEVEILLDGERWNTRQLSLDQSSIEADFRFRRPGDYSIEMRAEGQLPEGIDYLREQESLDFQPPKAHVAWEVTVTPDSDHDPATQQSDGLNAWSLLTDLLAVVAIIEYAQDAWGRMRGQVDDATSEEDTDDDEQAVNMTLDDFRRE
ncbi:hypothetical protein ACFQL9_13300 [Halobaculum lipolyticum]|uniref:Uncharacterized protein n=1 Tax=Halobaculum lipolyticum TaxID=3032001 RepID=A0ABD5WF89_9EURY